MSLEKNWKILPREMKEKILCEATTPFNISLIYDILGKDLERCQKFKDIVLKDPKSLCGKPLGDKFINEIIIKYIEDIGEKWKKIIEQEGRFIFTEELLNQFDLCYSISMIVIQKNILSDSFLFKIANSDFKDGFYSEKKFKEILRYQKITKELALEFLKNGKNIEDIKYNRKITKKLREELKKLNADRFQQVKF